MATLTLTVPLCAGCCEVTCASFAVEHPLLDALVASMAACGCQTFSISPPITGDISGITGFNGLWEDAAYDALLENWVIAEIGTFVLTTYGSVDCSGSPSTTTTYYAAGFIRCMEIVDGEPKFLFAIFANESGYPESPLTPGNVSIFSGQTYEFIGDPIANYTCADALAIEGVMPLADGDVIISLPA